MTSYIFDILSKKIEKNKYLNHSLLTLNLKKGTMSSRQLSNKTVKRWRPKPIFDLNQSFSEFSMSFSHMTFEMFHTAIFLYMMKYYCCDISEIMTIMQHRISCLIENINSITTRNRKPFAVTKENYTWSLPLLETINALYVHNAEDIPINHMCIRRKIYNPMTLLYPIRPEGYKMNISEIVIKEIHCDEKKVNIMRKLMEKNVKNTLIDTKKIEKVNTL